VSSTVSTSSVELTARLTSPRAVSFSTDWVSSLVGKGLQQLDLAVGERPGLAAGHHDDADGIAFPQHGDEEAASKADRTRHGFIRVLGIELDVGYVDHRALQDRPGRPQGPGWAHREYAVHLLEGFGSEVVLGDMMDQLAVVLIERAEESIAQPHGASHDGVEDRLHVGRRPADDAQDLRRRRLLFEGLGNLRVSNGEGAVLFLELSEQPHVLDGDHGLVGEGLHERDLLVGERFGL
jgi:hypothetical protein